MEFNQKQLLNLYEKEENITRAAKAYCEANSIEYTDSIRRSASRVINKTYNSISEPKHSAKILSLDIETAPLKSYIWGVWNQNIGHSLNMLENDWFMLTWSAKWLFDETIMSDKLTAEEVKDENDKRICLSLWELLNEADFVVIHNGVKFDAKRYNTRFLFHGITPPFPYSIIDTLLHARKRFAITSNKLDYIGKFLGLGQKIDTGGFDLWKRCMNGDESALQEMETYNIQDVRLLEEVYLTLLPFIKPHPNIGLFVEEDVHVCPSCGSKNIEWGGTYTTYANQYDAFRCGDCGSIGRSRTAKRKNKNLTIATPS